MYGINSQSNKFNKRINCSLLNDLCTLNHSTGYTRTEVLTSTRLLVRCEQPVRKRSMFRRIVYYTLSLAYAFFIELKILRETNDRGITPALTRIVT